MALNAPIQGSAADIIKLAMKGVDAALTAEGLRSRILLQVHDELVLEVAPGEREARRGAGAPRDGGGRRRWTCRSTSASAWVGPGTTRRTDGARTGPVLVRRLCDTAEMPAQPHRPAIAHGA